MLAITRPHHRLRSFLLFARAQYIGILLRLHNPRRYRLGALKSCRVRGQGAEFHPSPHTSVIILGGLCLHVPPIRVILLVNTAG